MRTVLRNILAVIDGGATAKRVNLQIDGTIISVISKDPLPIDDCDVVIDGAGKFAIPGFVNAHTHLPMVLFRGLADDISLRSWLENHIWPLEKALRPADVYWASLLALAEMIRTGTTTFADMYFHTDATGKAVEASGLRAVLSHGIIAQKLDAQGKAELEETKAVISRWEGAGAGRIRTAVSPHALYTCGHEVWKEAIALVEKYGVILHTHLAESKQEVEKCREERGMSPVAALDRMGVFSVPTLAAHCVHVDETDISLLAKRGVAVAHCPKSNAKLGNGIAPVEAMRKAGVTVALGTDGAASNNSLNMIEEMRMASLLEKATTGDPAALPAWEVLRMATQAGAEALGMGTGSLAVGQEADIVLVDLNHPHSLPAYEPVSALVYAGYPYDVTDVLVAGRFLLRNRELVTIDEERVKHEVKSLSERYKT